MAAMQLLFACCVRGRNRRDRRQIVGPDAQVIPDEESRLIPPSVEPEVVLPDTVAQEIEERIARLGTIVRAKEGNMINTSAYAPFNVLNRPNRYSPQRYGPNRSASSNRRSVSRSISRDPSTTRRPSHSTPSVARYGYLANGYGYGAVGISYNPSLAHTMSMPAPLEPQSSEVQVQIESAADGRASLERSTSSKGNKKKKDTFQNADNAGASSSGTEPSTDSDNKPPLSRPSPHPRFRSSLVMSPSSTSLPKTASHESFSDNNSNNNPFSTGPEDANVMRVSGGGLGVRLVQQPLLSAGGMTSAGVGVGSSTMGMGMGMSRRGRPKVKAGGAVSSGSSGSLVRVRSKEDNTHPEGYIGTNTNGSGQSSSEQTPRPLNTLPVLSMSPATPYPAFLAPPPSPHSDRNSDSGQSMIHTPPQGPSALLSMPTKPPPLFEIKDEGELTIGWDD
ncbi:hypothetical protein FB446DRAFT_736366 [Lentinula raphanica]|nr:hypothetical protein FB446DRAFT_736366 [Lentinula raphanica]